MSNDSRHGCCTRQGCAPFVGVGSILAIGGLVALVTGIGVRRSLIQANSGNSIPTRRVLLTGFGPFLNFSTNPSEEVAKTLHGYCSNLPATRAHGPARVCIDSLILDVNQTGAHKVFDMLQGHARSFDEAVQSGQNELPFPTFPYDAIMHMGLEDFAKGLRIEVAAANYKANDSGGPPLGPLDASAPHLLGTTLDLGLVSTLNLTHPITPLQPADADRSTGSWGRGASWPSYTDRSITHAAVIAADDDGDDDGGGGSSPRQVEELWSRDPGQYYCNQVYFSSLMWVRGKGFRSNHTGQLTPVVFVHLPAAEVSSPNQSAVMALRIAELIAGSTVPPAVRADRLGWVGTPREQAKVVGRFGPDQDGPAPTPAPGLAKVGVGGAGQSRTRQVQHGTLERGGGGLGTTATSSSSSSAQVRRHNGDLLFWGEGTDIAVLGANGLPGQGVQVERQGMTQRGVVVPLAWVVATAVGGLGVVLVQSACLAMHMASSGTVCGGVVCGSGAGPRTGADGSGHEGGGVVRQKRSIVQRLQSAGSTNTDGSIQSWSDGPMHEGTGGDGGGRFGPNAAVPPGVGGMGARMGSWRGDSSHGLRIGFSSDTTTSSSSGSGQHRGGPQGWSSEEDDLTPGRLAAAQRMAASQGGRLGAGPSAPLLGGVTNDAARRQSASSRAGSGLVAVGSQGGRGMGLFPELVGSSSPRNVPVGIGVGSLPGGGLLPRSRHDVTAGMGMDGGGAGGGADRSGGSSMASSSDGASAGSRA